jgi:hypothetical protein
MQSERRKDSFVHGSKLAYDPVGEISFLDLCDLDLIACPARGRFAEYNNPRRTRHEGILRESLDLQTFLLKRLEYLSGNAKQVGLRRIDGAESNMVRHRRLALVHEVGD